MNIWLVTIGEPLPTQSKERLHRTGILAKHLISAGHQVTWWSATFDHFSKKHLFDSDQDIQLEKNYRLILFHAKPYARNISFSRIINHMQVARKFAKTIQQFPKPDAIVAAFPTIELCKLSAIYGKKHGVPVYLDIRDLWPDIFLNPFPKFIRPFAKPLLFSMFRATAFAFKTARGLIGTSEDYLDWGLRYADRRRSTSDLVAPLGYDKDDLAPSYDASKLLNLGIRPDKTILWFIGTFGQTYDLHPIFQLARRLHEEGDDRFQFVISGSGDKDAEYRKAAQDCNNVVFTGWIQKNDILYMMSIAKVGLAPYAKGAPQSLPNKFFEYFACGVPVFSSLKGESEALLLSESCGVLFEPADADDCYAKFKENIKNLDSFGKNAKQLFDTKFSASLIYPKYIAHILPEVTDR